MISGQWCDHHKRCDGQIHLLCKDARRAGQFGLGTRYPLYAKYKFDGEYSYTYGAFPTYELIDSGKPVAEVIVSERFTGMGEMRSKCASCGIPFTVDEKTVGRLRDKENVYCIGVFGKFSARLEQSKPHVALVNPSDMGNLGTIMRTCAAVGIEDIGIVTPAADMFHPKTVRASMGALFRVRVQTFGSFDEYLRCYPARDTYAFMTGGEHTLETAAEGRSNAPFSLVFGNEASGLPEDFKGCGKSVRLAQTTNVDSYALPVAVGIGAYIFMTC